MNALSKKLLLSTSCAAIRRCQHTKIFPDDKWLTLKALKAVQAWCARQMARVDEQCGRLEKPEFCVKEDAPLKEKIMVELKPDMLKYRLLFAICYARCRFQKAAGGGLEKAPPEIEPIQIHLSIDVHQTKEKKPAPESENENLQIAQVKASVPPKDLN